MNGLFLVDKPRGPTSHDIVQVVRRITGTRRVGHAGTLDPMATGLLIVLVGKATRLSRFLLSEFKEYEAEITFGVDTDTFDSTGAITAQAPCGLTEQEFCKLACGLVGRIAQTPPPVSAIKMGGEPLYAKVRRGEAVLPPERVVEVEWIKAISFEAGDAPKALVAMRVSKGTYVRSIAHDMGVACGCGAVLSSLRRTASGAFDVGEARTLEELEALGELSDLQAALIGPGDALRGYPRVIVARSSEAGILSGRKLEAAAIAQQQEQHGALSEGQVLAAVSEEGKLLAVMESTPDFGDSAVARPLVVFSDTGA